MLSTAEIRALLPHRFPMLLIDAVTDLVPGRSLTAVTAISANEPWYAGLPDDLTGPQLAYPEALLVESWCQAAGVLATVDAPNPDVLTGRVMLFGGISDVVFHRAVLPGDVLHHRVRLQRSVGGTLVFDGRSVLGDAVVMTVGRITMALRPAGELRSGPRHAVAGAIR